MKPVQDERIKEISKKIYSLFVVNTCAAGIQQRDGRYITKYIPISPELIERMIATKGSMGCYQQGYKTGYIKWICLDFDCKEKESPDLFKLYNEVIVPVKRVLDQHSISYLTEFSGRRGIHIWIIFDCIVKKAVGFQILSEIIRLSGIDERNELNDWNLDRFPATDSNHNNRVGKQVKFPLSTHQKTGSISYFFKSDFSFCSDVRSERFFNEQYSILDEFIPNDIANVLHSLKLNEVYKRVYKHKYKKYRLLNRVDISVDEIWNILVETKVFANIYERMKKGQALPVDWTVILGTLSPCDSDGEIIKAVLQEFPNYDEEKTINHIRLLKDRFYPATFGYLYYLYSIDIEAGLDVDQTGFSYLLEKLNIPNFVVKNYKTYTEKMIVNNVLDTIHKEKNYLFDNDEVPDVFIFNMLDMIKKYDMLIIEEEIAQACSGKSLNRTIEPYRAIKRKESEEKERTLISLSAKDRVITTHLAVMLYYKYRKKWNSFSYRPSVLSREDIFYSWYNSWSRYIDWIQSILSVPFYGEFGVVYIDLKGFYDNIDFLTVYNSMIDDADEQEKNILNYLIRFNDSLMTHLNCGNRLGVPQGPAYARIIAELFLNIILSRLEEDFSGKIKAMRYVDDIFFLCSPEVDSRSFFNTAVKTFEEYGLPINTDKSFSYGQIDSLTDFQKSRLLHLDSFNYDLRCDDKAGVLLADDRKTRQNHFFISHDFDIRYLGYVFGGKTFRESKDWVYANYRREIFSGEIGRGSNYRRFYQFLFNNDEYFERAIEEKLFSMIPKSSVNFSNCLASLYYALREGTVNNNIFIKLKQEYLKSIDQHSIDSNDRAVLNALLMI